MKILVISDIHGNLTALNAVLNDANSFDAVWCLGDLVGYGPDPNEVIEKIKTLPNLHCVIGNHDAATIGLINIEAFNYEAREALTWTQSALKPENYHYLENLPDRLDLENFTLAHGSPRFPVWEYLLDTKTATDNFAYFDNPYCCVGHSHLPIIYYLSDESVSAHLLIPDEHTQTALNPRMILNPGSVGQPRDRNPHASYAILDTDTNTWAYHRVAYDVAAVQQRMREAGLPERHITRLSNGW